MTSYNYASESFTVLAGPKTGGFSLMKIALTKLKKSVALQLSLEELARLEAVSWVWQSISIVAWTIIIKI